VYQVGRVTSRTKGQVGCRAINPRRKAERCKASHAAPPCARLPIAHGRAIHLSIACPSVPPGPVECLSSLAATSPHFIRLSRFPKISLPHSQRSLPNARYKLLPTTLCLRNSGSCHGRGNHHLPEPPIPFAKRQPISIHIALSSSFLRIPPSSTAGRSSHRRSTLTSLCSPQASLLCTTSTPIGRFVAHIGP
jgi:hypothetical protein